MKVVLGVIGNGRYDFLQRTTQSLRERVNYPFFKKIMINDTGDLSYAHKLDEEFSSEYAVISHPENRGLSGSIRTLWEAAQILDADYIFHVEEDFTFEQDVDIDRMISILKMAPHLWQVALKRQPVNPEEAEAGGFMQLDREAYMQFYSNQDPSLVWVEHRKFFTLNPCVYSIDITRPLWPQGGGEREFAGRVFMNPESTCAFLGSVDDPPLVDHIGNYRGGNWFV